MKPIVRLNGLLKECGYNTSYVSVPRLRGLHDINQGILDGDFTVTNEVPHQLKNIIVVNKPIALVEISAFFNKDTDVKISDPNSLKQYRVGYIKGWRNVREIAPFGILSEGASNQVNLFKMLLAGRFDVIILERGFGEYVAASFNLPGKPFIASKVLRQLPVYLLLNKKHAALRDKLEAAAASRAFLVP